MIQWMYRYRTHLLVELGLQLDLAQLDVLECRHSTLRCLGQLLQHFLQQLATHDCRHVRWPAQSMGEWMIDESDVMMTDNMYFRNFDTHRILCGVVRALTQQKRTYELSRYCALRLVSDSDSCSWSCLALILYIWGMGRKNEPKCEYI